MRQNLVIRKFGFWLFLELGIIYLVKKLKFSFFSAMTPLLLSILIVSSLTLSGMAAICYLFPRGNSPH